jgi:hypothetical protein
MSPDDKAKKSLVDKALSPLCKCPPGLFGPSRRLRRFRKER